MDRPVRVPCRRQSRLKQCVTVPSTYGPIIFCTPAGLPELLINSDSEATRAIPPITSHAESDTPVTVRSLRSRWPGPLRRGGRGRPGAGAGRGPGRPRPSGDSGGPDSAWPLKALKVCRPALAVQRPRALKQVTKLTAGVSVTVPSSTPFPGRPHGRTPTPRAQSDSPCRAPGHGRALGASDHVPPVTVHGGRGSDGHCAATGEELVSVGLDHRIIVLPSDSEGGPVVTAQPAYGTT
eukprot:266365-Hanusia_phi.AAC.1